MWPFSSIRRFLRKSRNPDARLKAIQEALGRIESRQLEQRSGAGFADNEFRVYSQGGEDGLIQFLLRHVPIERTIFVEFGVEDYEEANTRFLLVDKRWSGLVIDASRANVASIQADPLSWRSSLRAVCAHVTAENINALLRDNGLVGDIGLLSVDIDGNDYWVWKAIDAVSPRIVIVEYNSRFGTDDAVTVPYDAAFDRRKAHFSMLYFGASLRALVELGQAKGYSFVGCNAGGVNAFFVRDDVLGDLPAQTVERGFRMSPLQQARNRRGTLSFLSPAQETALLRTLPLVSLPRPAMPDTGPRQS